MGEAGCKARARGTGRAAVLPQAPLEQRRACRCVYDALGVQRGQQAAQGGLHRAGARLSPRGVMRRSWIDLTPMYLSCWGRRCLAAARTAWGVSAAQKSTGRNEKRLGR